MQSGQGRPPPADATNTTAADLYGIGKGAAAQAAKEDAAADAQAKAENDGVRGDNPDERAFVLENAHLLKRTPGEAASARVSLVKSVFRSLPPWLILVLFGLLCIAFLVALLPSVVVITLALQERQASARIVILCIFFIAVWLVKMFIVDV
jgi:hypothetical protein